MGDLSGTLAVGDGQLRGIIVSGTVYRDRIAAVGHGDAVAVQADDNRGIRTEHLPRFIDHHITGQIIVISFGGSRYAAVLIDCQRSPIICCCIDFMTADRPVLCTADTVSAMRLRGSPCLCGHQAQRR